MEFGKIQKGKDFHSLALEGKKQKSDLPVIELPVHIHYILAVVACWVLCDLATGLRYTSSQLLRAEA